MLQLLFDYFLGIFSDINHDGSLDYIFDYFTLTNSEGLPLGPTDYFAFICAHISIIVIIVLCCLFIAKLVKGVAHLITR